MLKYDTGNQGRLGKEDVSVAFLFIKQLEQPIEYAACLSTFAWNIPGVTLAKRLQGMMHEQSGLCISYMHIIQRLQATAFVHPPGTTADYALSTTTAYPCKSFVLRRVSQAFADRPSRHSSASCRCRRGQSCCQAFVQLVCDRPSRGLEVDRLQ